MKSNYIKACLFSYYRFGQAHKLVASEVGWCYSADFIAVNQRGYSTEVEIKTSKSDFNADFKKMKHQHYTQPDKYRKTPNSFYFCVPKELVAHAVSKVEGTKYGVMECVPMRSTGEQLTRNINIVVKAKKLHKVKVSKAIIDAIVTRCSSEIAGLRLKAIHQDFDKIAHLVKS